MNESHDPVLMPFNELTAAEAERLALLSEELGEAQQAIGKILRHGYESYCPYDEKKVTNRASLERECGDVRHAMIRLCAAGDLSKQAIHHRAEQKAVSVQQYLHHQPHRFSQPSDQLGLTFAAFRAANVARCLKWHPQGIESWSPSDWLTALAGELGELASLLKMRNRERDGLPGNKFSPTDKQVADEIADVLTYLDLLAAALGVDLGRAAVEKFNEVSERVGFPDRIELGPHA